MTDVGKGESVAGGMLRRGVVGTVAAGVLGVTALAVGGSWAPGPREGRAGNTVERAASVQQAKPALAPAEDNSCHPVESYRPQGPLPKVGHMPAGSTMAKIVARGRLIAGVDQNTYLFGYRNPLTGQLDGFDIELLREVSTALFGSPDRIEYRTIPSARRISVLTDPKSDVDIVAHSMTINCDRWKHVDFSTDYLDAGQRVLVAKTSTATSIDDLAGKRVCAAGGTTSLQTLKDLKKHPVVPVAVKDWTDCLMLMQLGRVDAISTDDSILIGLAAQDPTTKVIGPRFTQEPHGIAMRKGGRDFVRFVNGVLERMRQDGSWLKLYRHWLGDGDGTTAPPPAAYRD